MVDDQAWSTLAALAQEHCTFRILRPTKRTPILPETQVAEDMGLQGELAEDFLEAVVECFPCFELSVGRGDFDFNNYFLSQISQSAARGLLYVVYRDVRKMDRLTKMPLTLGMLHDALCRGYWETARYIQWREK